MAVTYGTISYLPRTFPGLQIWLDANDTSTLFDSDVGGNVVTSDNATIGRWEDKSGNNFHVTQSTESFRPVLKTGIRNGRNVLRWDGVTSKRSMATVNLADNWSNLTCFAIIQRFSNGENGFGRVWERGNTLYRSYFGGATGLTVRVSTNVGVQNAFGFPLSTWYLATFQWNGGPDTSTDIFQRVNRSRVASSGNGSGSISSAVNTPFNLGNNANRNRAYDGDIAEILIYNNQLSEDQIISVENFLGKKWGFY